MKYDILKNGEIINSTSFLKDAVNLCEDNCIIQAYASTVAKRINKKLTWLAFEKFDLESFIEAEDIKALDIEGASLFDTPVGRLYHEEVNDYYRLEKHFLNKKNYYPVYVWLHEYESDEERDEAGDWDYTFIGIAKI